MTLINHVIALSLVNPVFLANADADGTGSVNATAAKKRTLGVAGRPKPFLGRKKH